MNDLIEETATFFETRNDTKKYTVGCMKRRAMILSMLSTTQALSVNQVWRRTPEANRATAERMLKAMVRQGLAKSRVIKKATDQTNRKYVLTNRGKMVALAVAYEYRDNLSTALGINFKETLEELFQPSPERDAVDILYSYWALNMLSRGMTNYVMENLHRHIKETETKGRFVSPAYFHLQQLPTAGKYVRQVAEAFVQAFQVLTDKEKDEAMQFAKGITQNSLREIARVTENEEILEQADASMKDPTKLVMTGIKKRCWRCEKPIGKIRFGFDEVYRALVTPEATVIPCPHCGANLMKMMKLDNAEADMNEIYEKLMKKVRSSSILQLPEPDKTNDKFVHPVDTKPQERKRI